MKEKNGLFLCEECNLMYKEEIWAEKCEKWCREHNSCNIKITKHAVPQTGFKLE
ncbi:MAG: hypothetical protein KAQ65_10415 [Candidatus Thorarchaeota archaeon]|nr:hypothetical protein [Candidatus Thorarchaeota archaeon]